MSRTRLFVRNGVALIWAFSGCFGDPSVSLPSKPVVFPQQFPQGRIIAKLQILEPESVEEISFEAGSTCAARCFGLSRNPATEVQIVRSSQSWQTCFNSLSPPEGTDSLLAPGLYYCDVRIRIRTTSSSPVIQTLRIFANRAPTLDVGVTNAALAENATFPIEIARIRTNDPDNRSFMYRQRVVELTSCKNLGPACLWRLSGTGCTDGLECKINSEAVVELTLSLAGELDYETASLHQIRLRTVDAIEQSEHQQNSLEVPLTLQVTDVQDTPPIFNEYPTVLTLAELSPVGHVVDFVVAVDGDRGPNPSTITYEICLINGDRCDGGILGIEIDTSSRRGNIVVKEQFKIEDFPMGYFTVRITAREIETGDATSITFRVVISDVDNHVPEFFRSESGVSVVPTGAFVASIDENSGIGTLIELVNRAQIYVQDRDSGVNAEFTVILNPDDLFEVSPSGVNQGYAYLTVRARSHARLDAERDAFLLLDLVATPTNPGGTPATAVLNVTINDVNDHPSIVDKCVGGSVEVSLDELTGRTIIWEAGSWKDEDRDAENRDFVQFRSLSPAESDFSIHTNGSLELIGRLDFERRKMHEIRMEVDNVGRNSVRQLSSCQITVKVSDANDESPAFTIIPYSTATPYNVRENALPRSSPFVASDPDTDADLRFSIDLVRADGPGGAAVPGFSIHDYVVMETQRADTNSALWQGIIVVKKALDREVVEKLQVIVRVTDLNADARVPNQIAEVPFAVNVEDVNDNAPLLRYNNIEVDQSISLPIPELSNRTTYMFSVTDKDSVPFPVQFNANLVAQDPRYQDNLVVEPVDGRPDQFRVSIAKEFLFIEVQSVNYTFTVFDEQTQNGNRAQIILMLEIQDVNDHSPVIVTPKEAEEFTVKESSSEAANFVPQVIFTVKAEDADSDLYLPFEYGISLRQAELLADKITIDKRSGQVMLTAPVDREEKGFDQPFTILVNAIDNSNSPFDFQTSQSVTVRLRITDVNDNAPVVAEEAPITVTIIPNHNFVGRDLFNFKPYVTDRDDPQACGFLDYRLQGDVSLFSVDAQGGIIKLANKLPDLTNTVSFQVVVSDGSKTGCEPGHTVAKNLIVKLLSAEFVYELVVDIENDEPELSLSARQQLNRTLSDIASGAGYDYIFYSLEPMPLGPRAKTKLKLSFSFLQKGTYEPAVQEKITEILSANQLALENVGVTWDTPVPPEPGMSYEEVGLIVLGVVLAVILVITAVFFVETRTIQQNGEIQTGDPDAPEGPRGLKRNPLHQEFGDDVPDYTFKDRVELEDQELGHESVDMDHFSRRQSAISGRSQSQDSDIEAGIARANRENLQKQLKNGGY